MSDDNSTMSDGIGCALYLLCTAIVAIGLAAVAYVVNAAVTAVVGWFMGGGA